MTPARTRELCASLAGLVPAGCVGIAPVESRALSSHDEQRLTDEVIRRDRGTMEALRERIDAAPGRCLAARLLVHLAAMLCLALSWTPASARDDGITDYLTIPAGSYIVDTGSLAPTVANAMRPYGLVFDLVRNQKVPVLWAINPAKTKDGVDFTDPVSGKSYRAGAFVVRAGSVTPAVLAVINSWRTQGVAVDGPTTAAIANVPVYDSITGLANVVSDLANGKIAEAFMTAAGIPPTAYRRDTPVSLSSCDDMFIMPHADPTWASHRSLLPFVKERGYLWSGCHAVSVLENIDNPATPVVNPDMNFLSTTGLVPFGDHSDGSPPYTSIRPGDPVMQFIGTTDAAQQGGSEQIYLPKKGGSWRAGARLLVTDPTTADIPANSDGPAAAIVVGRGFDNPSYGRVMYEGGHNVGGTAPANIAAQRAFLNFWLLALIDRSPDVAIQSGGITTVNEGGTLSLTAGIDHPFPITSYQWTSSGGGTFSSPNSATTTFTPPEVTGDTPLLLRVTVIDGCGRQSFDAYQVTVRNVDKADLSINKTDSADPVEVNGAFSYSLAVSNLGSDAAANVVVRDVLPTGLGFVSASGSGWTCGYDASTRTVTCTRPTLALTAGTPSNIVVNVTGLPAAGRVTNSATVSADTPDLVVDNNSAAETTSFVAGIDVAITKTAPAGPVYAGASFAYTLNVSNLSALSAANLTVDDVLPAALSYVGASGSGWNCTYQATDRRVTCFRALLAAGASAPITLMVTPSGSPGQNVANTATVSSPSFQDQVPANNRSTASLTLAAGADLRVAKTGSTTGGGGTQVDTFVVTLTNLGPGTATGILVTDIMSGPGTSKYNATSACTVTPSTGSTSPASPWSQAQVLSGGTWSIASLASGAAATLTLACTGDNNDGVTNRVRVSSTSYDPVTSNNSADAYVVDGSFTVTDLRVTKTASSSPEYVNGTLTYRLRLDNLSTVDANNVHTVTDTLPAGVRYVGFANVGGGTWSCTESAGTVTCTTGSDLKKLGGSPDTLFFDLTVTAPATAGSITNTASSFYDWGNDRYDPPANNTASVTSTVVYHSSDVAVTKSASTMAPAVDANVTFTVTVTNNGPSAVSNLRVQDVLPASLRFVSASAAQGSYDPGSGLWYVGALGIGGSSTLSLTAKTTGTMAATNQACVYALDQTDTNPSNNCGSVTVAPQSANLRLAKTADTLTPALGSNVTFTVTLTNLGPSSTSAATVVDQLLEGFNYVSHLAAGGTFDPGTGIWSVPGALASGASATLTLVAQVSSAGTPLTNTASIISSSVSDPDPSNNTASITVTGQAADIAISKTVDVPAPPALNTPLTFTLTATNNGPSDAGGVVLTDLLPAGLSYQSHVASQGAYVPGTGAWSVGALANGATATLTLVATNTAYGTLVNTVTLATSDPPDPGDTDDSASVVILSGGSVDLSLTQNVDRPATFQGDTVTFTVKLENTGPDPATGVVIEDLLPTGLAYVSSAASQGSYDAATGLWTVGAVAVSQQVELLIMASAGAAGQFTNMATVKALNQADPDDTNNSSLAVIAVSASADLSVTEAGPGVATLGAAVSYTLVARNIGPADVSGALLVDTVPTQVTGTSWTCVASGSADCDTFAAGTGASGSGNVISLSHVAIAAGAGNFLTVTIVGTAGATGTFTNAVILSPPEDASIFDPDTSNNFAAITTVVSNRLITGRVFVDDGAGGGTPNDGVHADSEAGIAGVALRLTDCGATTYARTTADGAGNYVLAIPDAIPNGATLCVAETNPSGYVSTGGQPGDTGGSYDRDGDRLQFTATPDSSYTGVDFGDVPQARLLTDGSRTVQPGDTVSFPHVFIAGTGGQVTFSTAGASSPDVPGWSEVLYRDTDCDAELAAPGDAPLAGALGVAAGERVCLIVQQFVPATVPAGATRLVTLQAFFVYTNASPVLTASSTRQDLTATSDGALLLLKEVRNVTRSGPWLKSNLAGPGDLLEYRIHYSNTGSTAIADLVINDMTPAFTSFVSSACGLPLPALLTLCTPVFPVVGAVGPVKWQFTGSLQPGTSGSVSYQVQVD